MRFCARYYFSGAFTACGICLPVFNTYWKCCATVPLSFDQIKRYVMYTDWCNQIYLDEGLSGSVFCRC